MLCFLYFQYKLEQYALRFCEISFATLFLNLKKLHTTGAMRKCFVRFTLTQQQVLRQIRFFDVRIDSIDGRTCALQLDNEHFQKTSRKRTYTKNDLPACNGNFLQQAIFTKRACYLHLQKYGRSPCAGTVQKNIFPLQNNKSTLFQRACFESSPFFV